MIKIIEMAIKGCRHQKSVNLYTVELEQCIQASWKALVIGLCLGHLGHTIAQLIRSSHTVIKQYL